MSHGIACLEQMAESVSGDGLMKGLLIAALRNMTGLEEEEV